MSWQSYQSNDDTWVKQWSIHKPNRGRHVNQWKSDAWI